MQLNHRILLIATAGWLCGWTFAAAGQSPPTLSEGLSEIRAEIQERVDSGELPSLAVGVIDRDELIWKETFGWADCEAQVPASSSTPYGLASLGKSITATAVMTLVESGKIGLDDRIAPYLAPDSLWSPRGYAEGVTLRNLLNMTASIPHGGYYFLRAKDAAPFTPARLVRERGLVAFPPGEVSTYSNFDYGMLEDLIERITGVSYEQFLRDALFRPLAMTSSSAGHGSQSGDAAIRYAEDGSRLEPVYSRPQSSLALQASLDDLLRYARFHLGEALPPGHPLLSSATLQKMHTEKAPVDRALFALGWGSIDLNGDLWLLTNGRSSGVQSTLTLWPSANAAVVVLTNSTGNVTDDLAFRILDQLVPDFLDRFETLKNDMIARSQRQLVIDDALAGRWSGRVSSRSGELPFELTFESEGEVRVRLGDQPPTTLKNLGWDEGLMGGRFEGKLDLEETTTDPYRIDLNLRLADGRLEGYAVAVFDNPRGRYVLPALVGLERTPEDHDRATSTE